jgi:CBS domain-containing protein
MAGKIRDIMSPVPVSLAPTESAATAARAMKEHGVGTVLILTDGKLSGLVTDRDITVRVLAENRDPLNTLVSDICSTELAVLGPDDDVDQATRLVRDRAVRRIPVVQDGIPVGIVSIADLALMKDRTEQFLT